ncbi:cytidine monophosphate-N-acetylneuraminic acid hydroxylase [Poecilia latipinna]|uniref:cytidine monophosphate-N-acetylneuraminic acid hydroxylase n=1 Tax=Poecilia latipinna TaxID=48699 RepID=UPI00072EDC65|nr:PREDICTED: cytidine monophosphate-N-acetylneuraminic acid hydroxylase-like [Poecilia latipinna]
MEAQTSKVVLSLNAKEVDSLKDGVSFKKNPEDGRCYIIYKSSGGFKACKNQCKHQGGLFIKDIEDLDGRTVKCTKHNWKLNVSSMKYVNPPDSFLQDELEVEMLDDGGMQLVELSPIDPWLTDPRDPLELQEGEVKITYLTHACMELQLGQKRFLFDPWLMGPAFARGWWLLHEPPADCLDRLCAADLIYISHLHSDHLRVLNTVDCTRPNGGRLPEKVDLMMSDFAGGASGFPMTFHGGKYSGELNTVQCCPGNIVGSFLLLNHYISSLRSFKFSFTASFAVINSSEAITDPPANAKIYKDSWEFDLYVDELNSAISSEIFKHESWIQFYYSWAGFQNYNLVVRMIETDDSFKPMSNGYDYLVDFLDLSFPSTRPDREHSYIEIKNRIGVMRYVVLHGGLWDDLYIGFQNRISRDPDTYHHKFWNHFQTQLPLHGPDWDQFLQQVPPIQETDALNYGLLNYCSIL